MKMMSYDDESYDDDAGVQRWHFMSKYVVGVGCQVDSTTRVLYSKMSVRIFAAHLAMRNESKPLPPCVLYIIAK
jgi:hypothetical protein